MTPSDSASEVQCTCSGSDTGEPCCPIHWPPSDSASEERPDFNRRTIDTLRERARTAEAALSDAREALKEIETSLSDPDLNYSEQAESALLTARAALSTPQRKGETEGGEPLAIE